MSANPIYHDCSKHIAVDYHFVRERVAAGDLVVRYIPTSLLIAKTFMKVLSSKLFLFLKSNLIVHFPNQVNEA